MGLIAAGLRGGVIEDAGSSAANLARRIFSGDATAEECRAYLHGHVAPRTLSCVVNNTCNLKCRHCYLQIERLGAPALTIPEWQQVFESVATQPVRLVSFSGKEVFLGHKGIDLLESLVAARQRHHASFDVGVITNGTLLGAVRERIEALGLAYLDISVDGAPEDHDAIRGAGAFALAEPNIRWAARTLGSKFFSSCTVQARNHHRLADTVVAMDRLGVRNIGFSFYKPMPYTDASLALDDSAVAGVFRSLEQIGELPLQNVRTVLFDADMLDIRLAAAFVGSEWFNLDVIRAERSGEVFIAHTLKNGAEMRFRFAPFPTGVNVTARLTTEGHYLAAEDTMNTREYERMRLANIREVGFDFSAMHRSARQSARVSEIFRWFLATVWPAVQQAYRNRSNHMAPHMASSQSHVLGSAA